MALGHPLLSELTLCHLVNIELGATEVALNLAEEGLAVWLVVPVE